MSNNHLERERWNKHCLKFYKDVPLYSDALKGQQSYIENSRLKLILSFFSELPCRGSMADIGCQEGYIANQLHKLGYDITAIDPNPSFIFWGKLKYPHIKFVEGFFEDQNYDQEFNWAIVTETLEHVCNPDEFLESIHKSLRHGGQAFISVPIASYGEYETHYKVWGKKELLNTISKYFYIVDHTTLFRWRIITAQKGIMKTITSEELVSLWGVGKQ